MSWQDDPVVGGGGWQNDPVVGSAQPGLAESLARTFAEGAGGGLADVALGAAGSASGSSSLPTIASQRARTAAAEDSLPWYVRYPVEGLGVGAGFLSGFGEAGWALKGAGGASDLARLYGLGEKGAARAAGAVKGAAEAGTYGAVSGAAHSDSADPLDIAWNGVTGGLTGGALGGAVGGALGANATRGVKGAAAKDIPTLEAEKTAAYDDLRSKPVASSGVRESIQGAYDELSPSELAGVSRTMRDQLGRIAEINSKTAPSADDVVSYGRNLWDTADSTAHFAPVDAKVAGKVNDYFDQMMNSYGYTDAANAAKQAHARLSDASEMEGLTVNTAPNWAKKQAAKPGMLYGDAEREALANLAKYADKPAPTGFWDTLGQQVTKIAQDKGIGYFGALAGHAGPIGAFGAPLAQAAIAAGAQGLRGNSIQKALDAAGATLTTGQLSTPGDSAIKQMLFNPKTRAAALRLIQMSSN